MERSHDDLDRVLGSGDHEPPPIAEEPPDRGPREPRFPPPSPQRVAAAIALVALGVAIERLTMIAFVATTWPSVLIPSGILFVTVPAVAMIIGIRAFNRQRAEDAALRDGWRRS